MPEKFTLKVETEFSSAHVINGYDGPCSRLHGHNWKVGIEVETTKLNNLGMGIDFCDLKQDLDAITAKLDHYNLNELEYFAGVNPTAENIAVWIFQQLETNITNLDAKLLAVTVWETNDFSIRYTKE